VPTSDEFGGQIRFSNLIGSRHCAAAFCLQVPEKCTDLELTLLHSLIRRTYTKFVREKKNSSTRRLLPAAMLEHYCKATLVAIESRTQQELAAI